MKTVLIITLFLLITPVTHIETVDVKTSFPSIDVGLWYFYNTTSNSTLSLTFLQTYAVRSVNYTILGIGNNYVRIGVNDTVYYNGSIVTNVYYENVRSFDYKWFDVFFNVTNFNESLEQFLDMVCPTPTDSNVTQILDITYGYYNYNNLNLTVVIVENLYNRTFEGTYIYSKYIISIDLGLMLERVDVFPYSPPVGNVTTLATKTSAVVTKLVDTNNKALLGNDANVTEPEEPVEPGEPYKPREQLPLPWFVVIPLVFIVLYVFLTQIEKRK